MLVKIANKNTMKKLRKVFPMKTGREIVKQITHDLLDENGNLLIEENVLEECMIGEHEFIVQAERKLNEGKGVEIVIKDMFIRL